MITPAGLVGVAYDVALDSARVRTILDPTTQVSAYVSRSGDEGMTRGSVTLAQEGLLRIDSLSRDAGASAGDIVATSGKGGLYPHGLKIGKIQAVEPDSDGLTMTATIEPFADIKNLTDVFVIIDFEEKAAATE